MTSDRRISIESEMVEAIKQYDYEVLRALFETFRGEWPESVQEEMNNLGNIGTPIHVAVSDTTNPDQTEQLVKFLIDHGIDSNAPNQSGRSPLEMCCGKQHRTLRTNAILLVERGLCSINQPSARSGMYPIHRAVQLKDTELFNVIMGCDEAKENPRGCGVDARVESGKNGGQIVGGMTPMSIAMLLEAQEILEILLRICDLNPDHDV